MNLYRVAGLYCGTQNEAKEIAKAHGLKFDPETHSIDVPVVKAELIAYLNKVTTPVPVDEFTPVVTRQDPPIEANGYAELSITIDEEWEKLPLARKFHFAAMAMEDARSLVPQLTGPSVAEDLL
jgi:hypothetical protein